MKITIKIVLKTAMKNLLKTAMKNVLKTAMKNVLKIAMKNVLKNYVCNTKEMSFLKISDPVKRDLIVKEYLELKKNIRDNLLSERTGEQELQTDLSKFFKPITQTQKATAREITEELKPIKEGIENLPNIITFPAYPSIRASREPLEGTDIQYISEVAVKALGKFLRKNEADTTFGIRDEDGRFKIGDRWVKIKGNDIEVSDKSGVVEKTYKGTPGLWELITAKEPNDEIIKRNDLENYAKLMVETNSLHQKNNPNKPRSADSYKWKNILSFIWHNRKSIRERVLLLFRVILTRS